MKTPTTPLPTAVKQESRTCFGISWYTSEEDAQTVAAHLKSRGAAYNGGYFHGMPCGRETVWDYVDADLGPLFAVTD